MFDKKCMGKGQYLYKYTFLELKQNIKFLYDQPKT
jgi:hypothetical protein